MKRTARVSDTSAGAEGLLLRLAREAPPSREPELMDQWSRSLRLLAERLYGAEIASGSRSAALISGELPESLRVTLRTDRQWHDAFCVLRVQGARLDRAYLERMAPVTRVGDLLEQASGPSN